MSTRHFHTTPQVLEALRYAGCPETELRRVKQVSRWQVALFAGLFLLLAALALASLFGCARVVPAQVRLATTLSSEQDADRFIILEFQDQATMLAYLNSLIPDGGLPKHRTISVGQVKEALPDE